MNHRQYREWLNLLVYDELEETERAEMQKNLEECAGCREELEERRKLFQVLDRQSGPEPSDALLQQARMDLRAALATLQKYPFDDEIQSAMICVLQNDPNPAIRIEAIKSLEGQKAEGQEFINALRDTMQSDNNSYIRQRAKAVLEEVH